LHAIAPQEGDILLARAFDASSTGHQPAKPTEIAQALQHGRSRALLLLGRQEPSGGRERGGLGVGVTQGEHLQAQIFGKDLQPGKLVDVVSGKRVSGHS
jgi:hypothetical protein